jgi:hypothetical protein
MLPGLSKFEMPLNVVLVTIDTAMLRCTPNVQVQQGTSRRRRTAEASWYFFVDPDGTVGILLAQVELGKDMWPLVAQFQSLHVPLPTPMFR